MRVLVTGASGFAGSLLVPRLHSEGHEVRAFGRNPVRVEEALARQHTDPQADNVLVLRGDALTGAGLRRALDGVEVAYYLIHSMENAPAQRTPFTERERIAAERFADAAARAGVRRIVYLGGLVPHWPAQTRRSRHLASREAVERILLDAVEDSVALRASIVIGTHSRSFRLLVHLVERLPVLTLPADRIFRTQPIDARDVTEMLVACAVAA